ncbi:hypothetical protein Hanom_Chr05g00421461 [Helianthus anomalus]
MLDNAVTMASTSDPRNASKMKSAAAALSGENQTLQKLHENPLISHPTKYFIIFSIFKILKKTMVTIKEIGVSMEKQNKIQMLKKLETEFVELLKAYEECANLSSVIDSIGLSNRCLVFVLKLTDFKKLIDNEMVKTKRRQVSQLLRQFKEAIWVCLCILFICV